MNTVKGWHKKYGWYERRLELEQQLKETFFEKFSKKLEINTNQLIDCSNLISRMAQEKLDNILKSEKFLNLEKNKQTKKDIAFWAKMAKEASFIRKNASPVIDEELGSKMAMEIEILKEQVNGKVNYDSSIEN